MFYIIIHRYIPRDAFAMIIIRVRSDGQSSIGTIEASAILLCTLLYIQSVETEDATGWIGNESHDSNIKHRELVLSFPAQALTITTML